MQELLKEYIGKDYSEMQSSDFENLLASEFAKLGTIKRQYKVPNRGDGRKGRIDFLISTSTHTIPVELDRHTPRKKSIFKVQSVRAPEAYVITRAPFTIHKY